MTQARARAHGVVTPSLSQLSLTATLRVLVRLVLGLASTLQMILNRRPRDWHMRATHEALPRETSEIHAPKSILRDDRRCASIPQDEARERSTESRCYTTHKSTEALILRDREAIVSKDGGALTALSTGSVFPEHAFPAKAGIQSARTARFQQGTALSPLIPTNVGIQGRSRTLSKSAASIPRTRQNRSWIPTFVGMSGYCRGQLRASA